ncbi:MAG: hypothetical protein QXL44_00290 [Candidatus Nitrosocaldus sp.]
MSFRIRCHICDGIAMDRCSICKRPVCSACMAHDNDGVCRRCALMYDELDTTISDEGSSGSGASKDTFRIGYTALRDIADIPMLIVGVSILIIGMLLISYASMNVSQMQGQGEGLNGTTDTGRGGGGGIVVIFPFPFVILVPDAGILALVMLLVMLVPFILFFLLMRRGLRFS